MAMSRRNFLKIAISGFFYGAGRALYAPGFYAIGTNFDGSYGGPGPREAIDLTGIAAGYRVVKMVRHADTPMLATTNGTNTIIYQIPLTGASAGVWFAVATINSRIATDLVSFKGVIAVAFGSSNPYQFVANVTTNSTAYTFAASTKTAANALAANYFLVQANGRDVPRVVYVTNPTASFGGGVYTTEDLTDTDATGEVPAYVGDSNTAAQYFTSLVEDDTGAVLIGMRHALFKMDGQGTISKITPDYPDPRLDAGGQSDRLNFEGPAVADNRIYYPVMGYLLGEYYHGQWNVAMAPGDMNGRSIPRMDLPINALCYANGWLYLAMGSANTATLKNVTYVPGGSISGGHLGNLFTTKSELWKGRYEDTPDGRVFVWHGAILLCTSLLRYIWLDEDTSYLYLASGDSESINLQQYRCLVYADSPLNHAVASVITLNAGTWTVELGRIMPGDLFDYFLARHISLDTLGLSGTEGTAPSVEVEYKITPDYVAGAFNSAFITFYKNADADRGMGFTDRDKFRSLYLRLVGVGTGNTYSVVNGGALIVEPDPDEWQARAIR